MPKSSKGICNECGGRNEYVFSPYGAEHECYDCGAAPASIRAEVPTPNELNARAAAGDQSDNAAAAQALSQTIQAPPDRSGDPSRVTGGTPECYRCGETKAVFPIDDENHICHGCAGDIQQSEREGRLYGGY